jgi:hypothetical protein
MLVEMVCQRLAQEFQLVSGPGTYALKRLAGAKSDATENNAFQAKKSRFGSRNHDLLGGSNHGSSHGGSGSGGSAAEAMMYPACSSAASLLLGGTSPTSPSLSRRPGAETFSFVCFYCFCLTFTVYCFMFHGYGSSSSSFRYNS